MLLTFILRDRMSWLPFLPSMFFGLFEVHIVFPVGLDSSIANRSIQSPCFFFVDDTMYKPMIHDFSTVYI